jgi:hypothetical protein
MNSTARTGNPAPAAVMTTARPCSAASYRLGSRCVGPTVKVLILRAWVMARRKQISMSETTTDKRPRRSPAAGRRPPAVMRSVAYTVFRTGPHQTHSDRAALRLAHELQASPQATSVGRRAGNTTNRAGAIKSRDMPFIESIRLGRMG